MLTITSLESVNIDFDAPQEILEQVFGPDGSAFGADWFEEADRKFSFLIEELKNSSNKKEKFLRQQSLIAKAIFTFAKNSGGNLHLAFYDVDNKLFEFQFSFKESGPAFAFQAGLRDYVQNSTGLQL